MTLSENEPALGSNKTIIILTHTKLTPIHIRLTLPCTIQKEVGFSRIEYNTVFALHLKLYYTSPYWRPGILILLFYWCFLRILTVET